MKNRPLIDRHIMPKIYSALLKDAYNLNNGYFDILALFKVFKATFLFIDDLVPQNYDSSQKIEKFP